MDTLAYILNKYNLNPDVRHMPIEIPNTGRDDLAVLFAELGFRVGAEIGVEQGLYSEVLCRANPDARLYAIDAWRAYRGYREHVSQRKLDDFYEATRERLAGYNCELVRKFSMDAVQDFEPESLDYVYIDANHSLRFVVEDITEWSTRVRRGGVVAGHDYRKTKAPVTMLHVVQAVHAYTDAWKVRPWFVLGRKEKIEGEIRDHNRSWFWVKP